MRLRAGMLRHFVYLLYPVHGFTAKGDRLTQYPILPYPGPIVESDRVRAEWVSIDPLGGRELLVARQMAGNLTHRIELRARLDLNHEVRIAWDDGVKWRYYEMGPALDIEHRQIHNVYYAHELL